MPRTFALLPPIDKMAPGVAVLLDGGATYAVLATLT